MVPLGVNGLDVVPPYTKPEPSRCVDLDPQVVVASIGGKINNLEKIIK